MTTFNANQRARERMQDGGKAGNGGEPALEAPLPEMTEIDLGKATDPGPTKWIVRRWVPLHRTSGLWGAGGAGKSTIAQLLLTCTAIGAPWFGLEVAQGSALGFFAEDDEDEVLRRQYTINKLFSITMADLVGKLHLLPRLGLPNTLALDRGELALTPTFEALRAKILEHKPKISAIDNITQCYGADPVSANHITGFVNACSGMARAADGAVILLGHPGKAEGNEYAGPYAWDAAVRSRMWLTGSKAGVRKLQRRKANHAEEKEDIDLEWRNGLYLPTDPAAMTYGDRLTAEMRRGEARQAFLDALDRINSQGQSLSDSKQANTFAPRTIVARGYVNGFSADEMERAMFDLFADGRILANQPLGKDQYRNTRRGIVRITGGDQE